MLVEIESWLAGLVPRFLANRARDLERLEEAFAAGDLSTLKSIGHMVRGSAAGYGFLDLSDAGARLEAIAETAGPAELRQAIDVIAHHVKGVEVVYR